MLRPFLVVQPNGIDDMTHRYSLHWRLPIVFSSLTLVALASFLWSGFTQVEATLLQAGGVRAESAADMVAGLLAQAAQQRATDLRRVAADPSLGEYLQHQTDASRRAAVARLAVTSSGARQVSEVWNVRGERVLFVSVPSGVAPLQERRQPPTAPGFSGFRAAGSVIFYETITDITTGPPAGDSQSGAAPVHIGYLVVSRSFRTTSSPDTLPRLVGNSAAVAVGDRGQGVWTDLGTVVPAPLVDRSRTGVAEYRTAQGERKLGALKAVPGTPWVVWVEFPRALILAPGRTFLKRMIGIGLLFVICAAAVTRMLTGRITAPLVALTTAAEGLAAGNYLLRIDIDRKDEIGRLGTAFNAMTAQIRADIAARREAELALRSSEDRTRFALTAAKIGVWEVELGTERLTWSDTMNAVHGTESAAFGGTRAGFLQTVHPADRDRVRDTVAASLRDRSDVDMEFRVIDAAGAVRWIHSCARLFSDGVKPARLVGVGINVTARKHAEDELRRTGDRLRAVIANVPIAIWAVDRAGTVTLFEGELTTRLGIDTRHAIGRSVFDIYEDAPLLIDATHRALSGECPTWSGDVRRMAVEGSYSPVVADDGTIEGAIGIIVDVSERRRLEAQIRQAQKMEAVGQLAGGVAHDFNNLLTAILGHSDLALDELPPGSVRHDIEQIQQAAVSAAALTAQLLAFSRKQILQPQILDLNVVVARMETLLRRLIGEDIELVTRPSPSLHRVSADPGQIEQVVLNLAVNARDAMPTGGRLTIETRNVDLDAAYVSQHTGCSPGPHVMIAVSDTGVGIDDSVKAHLFEPFYTTKERGKGTGLGLATVYGIVKQSGGSIWVSSELGHGTEFKVYLPLASVGSEHPSVVAPAPPLEGGTETILLVEDQPEVAAIARAVLSRHGYTVLSESSGPRALAMMEQYPGKIDLLLTDVIMPVMNGRELVARVVAARPAIRVMYTSGYTDDAIVTQEVRECGVAFLQKPFTPRTLLQKTREALEPLALHAG